MQSIPIKDLLAPDQEFHGLFFVFISLFYRAINDILCTQVCWRPVLFEFFFVDFLVFLCVPKLIFFSKPFHIFFCNFLTTGILRPSHCQTPVVSCFFLICAANVWQILLLKQGPPLLLFLTGSKNARPKSILFVIFSFFGSYFFENLCWGDG